MSDNLKVVGSIMLSVIALAFCSIFISCKKNNAHLSSGNWPVTLVGRAGFCTPKKLIMDNLDNVYLLGLCSGSVDVDSGSGRRICNSDYNDLRAFWVKYNSQGEYQSHVCLSREYEEQSINDLACGNQGEIVAIGSILKNSAGGGAYYDQRFYSAIYWRWDSNGNLIEQIDLGQYFLDNHSSQGMTIMLDSSDDILIAGRFESITDQARQNEQESHGNSTITEGWFICNFDSDGNLKWIRKWGRTSASIHDGAYNMGIELDENGSIYMTGSIVFMNQIVFDNGELVSFEAETGNESAFLLKLDNEGDFEWFRSWGGDNPNEHDYCAGLYMLSHEANRILVLGEFKGDIKVSTASGIESRGSAGESDVFLLAFDSVGSCQWVRTWGGPLHDDATCIFADDQGNFYCGGGYQVSEDYNPGPSRTLTHCSYLSCFDNIGQFEWVDVWLGGGGIRGIAQEGYVYLCRREKSVQGWGTRYENELEGTVNVDCIILRELL